MDGTQRGEGGGAFSTQGQEMKQETKIAAMGFFITFHVPSRTVKKIDDV